MAGPGPQVFHGPLLSPAHPRPWLTRPAPAEAGVDLATAPLSLTTFGVTFGFELPFLDRLHVVGEGSLKPNVTPKVVRDRSAIARIDAGLGYGQVAAKAGMELAIKKAREYGTGIVAIFNCNHAGRIADYPLLAAQNDMIGIMMVKAYGDLVAPWGGKGRLLATSPLSFAVPAKTSPPIVGDFATSSSAEGKVRVKNARGEKVPLGWLIDSRGKQTEDPADLYKGGALLTFGQWKGYALNLLMEATGGALTGAGVLESFTGLNGILAQAIDIDSFTDVEGIKTRIEALIAAVRNSPPADGFTEVLVPGDPEVREMERRMANGIPVEEKTWDRLADVAKRYGVRVPVVRP